MKKIAILSGIFLVTCFMQGGIAIAGLSAEDLTKHLIAPAAKTKAGYKAKKHSCLQAKDSLKAKKKVRLKGHEPVSFCLEPVKSIFPQLFSAVYSPAYISFAFRYPLTGQGERAPPALS